MYEVTKRLLSQTQKTWLITGVAGFIGSNLLEELLSLNQLVIGVDNFSTGDRKNLDEVKSLVSSKIWKNFIFIEGDICNLKKCMDACEGVDYVLHQAALGSVPRSIADPIATNSANVDGFLNMLTAARDAEVKRFVYAASSSTYGDHPGLPKVEDKIGNPLSPYAVTKVVNELYADVFAKVYGFNAIGLRYFNIFGKRQDPNGAYAAVIPKWISSVLNREDVFINGDGETSRDFCYIENVMQINILAALSDSESTASQVYNVALNDQVSLNELYQMIVQGLLRRGEISTGVDPIYRDFRTGDVRHSRADISKAKKLLGYSPTHNFKAGIQETLNWYVGS